MSNDLADSTPTGTQIFTRNKSYYISKNKSKNITETENGELKFVKCLKIVVA